jgi:hypothetical protein
LLAGTATERRSCGGSNIQIFTVIGVLAVGIPAAMLLQHLDQIYPPMLALGVDGFFLVSLIAARTRADTRRIALVLLVMPVIAAHPVPSRPSRVPAD